VCNISTKFATNAAHDFLFGSVAMVKRRRCLALLLFTTYAVSVAVRLALFELAIQVLLIETTKHLSAQKPRSPLYRHAKRIFFI
jgi:hypothetical protein